jgi:HK97 family phage portal protein
MKLFSFTRKGAADERALRPFNAGAAVIPRPGWWGWPGISVNEDSARGIPAVSAAVRLIAESIASLPIYVYSGYEADKRRADSSPQFALLHSPNDETTPFDFICDIASCVEWCGNAFVQKLFDGKRVAELYVLDPNILHVKRDERTGDKVFSIWENGTQRDLSPSEIIHVRGYSHRGGICGVSPITLYRDPLSAEMSMQKFVGNFYRNDARPGIVLSFPGNVNTEQAESWTRLWNSQHAGIDNAHKTAVIGGGADIKTLPINARDAQLIESRNFSTREVARMFRVPVQLLEMEAATPGVSTEEVARNFLNFYLLPRLRRIESALRADSDLFGGTNLYPEFFVDEFLRADAATKAEVVHKLVQSGVLTPDEGRDPTGHAGRRCTEPSPEHERRQRR